VSTPTWVNRIVRHSEEAPASLPASPLNWRTHPSQQAAALSGVLTQVGVVQSVIMNERTGRLVDGHLRVALALRDNQPTVPVVWVDLSEDEEKLILATLDPVAALAEADPDKLDALLRDIDTGDEAIQAMLADLAKDAGLYAEPLPEPGDADSAAPEEMWGVIVNCVDETQQATLLDRLGAEGYQVKALIA
jgi:ParB-like chromosome segregation protein Spo0J